MRVTAKSDPGNPRKVRLYAAGKELENIYVQEGSARILPDGTIEAFCTVRADRAGTEKKEKKADADKPDAQADLGA